MVQRVFMKKGHTACQTGAGSIETTLLFCHWQIHSVFSMGLGSGGPPGDKREGLYSGWGHMDPAGRYQFYGSWGLMKSAMN